MKIIVCDDDLDVSYIFQVCLTAHGHTVINVGSGYEALNVIEREGADVVITDYCMNQGDGGMLAHYCQENQITCIVVTGMAPEYVQPYLPDDVTVLGKVEFFDTLRRGRLVLRPAA